MQAQGSEQEQAAVTLGASGWQVFRRVTLPNIRWALLYGAVLCTARAVGEFGGVSVVAGSIRGKTNTLPLQIELLFNDYNSVGAFAAASTLTVIALVVLALKAGLTRGARAAAPVRSDVAPVAQHHAVVAGLAQAGAERVGLAAGLAPSWAK